jgi:glycerol-3-phosphate O-acyltransferase/dihydroxyacetone phosphate acyltransferase
MKLKFIGTMARIMGALPVARAQDMMKPGSGRIFLPDAENDPLLVRGVETKFESSEIQLGGTLVLPTVKGNAASAEVAEVLGPEEVRLKKGFRGADAVRQLTGRDDIDDNGTFAGNSSTVQKDFQGSKYKTAPKVDQTEVYNAVFDRLNHGGCVGIFPEGGSHDRTELLPLKGK